MLNLNISLSELSKRVSVAIKNKGWTLEKCCKAFNRKHSEDISNGIIAELNKDFVSRLIRNKFKLFNVRISKLCEFLNVSLEPYENSQINEFSRLSQEIYEFKQLITTNESLKNKFPSLELLLDGIANLGKNNTGDRI